MPTSHQTTLTIQAPGQGLIDITAEVAAVVAEAAIEVGLCTLFVRHTSASLVIQEAADPAARHDLETWLERTAPENDPVYTHTDEGPDDMPSHIRAMITSTSTAVPISDGKLALGTWQGIFLAEHRRNPRPRQVVVHIA